ncbi:MAG: hypothetical protein M1826_007599 [Phylliscum demangeonii]|nr:MAG: hypothetical protein M1826_007599 [Phylliscum demangeonii]
MEDPVKEIATVVRSLTQTPADLQRQTIERFFLPDASFIHPFCRTGSFPNSRWAIWRIYRWYKILSPRIEITINGIAFDQDHSRLYVDISQIFSPWYLPFYRAHPRLVAVIDLEYNEQRRLYFIKRQNDLYQVDEFVKFLWPAGWVVVLAWQFYNTFLSILAASLFWPLSWWEEKRQAHSAKAITSSQKKMESTASFRGP